MENTKHIERRSGALLVLKNGACQNVKFGIENFKSSILSHKV